jgi:hypothetical protein
VSLLRFGQRIRAYASSSRRGFRMREVRPHDNSWRGLQVSLLKVRRYALAQYSPLQLESWSLF